MVIVQEHPMVGYRDRTQFNAESGDVTLALAVDFTTAGEVLTHKLAGDKYIGFQLKEDLTPIQVARDLYRFMKERNAKTLNVAGNSIVTFDKKGYDQPAINAFLCDVLEILHRNYPLERIYSGGQTGTDLAAAVVAKYLGIPALITLPKGYKQRFEDDMDVTQTKESVEKQIDFWLEQLEHVPATVPPPPKKPRP
jgi:hypothetical protein